MYNATTDCIIGKVLSAPYWDALLKAGTLAWGFAADDTHWKNPDQGVAWVNVKAETLSRRAITTAMREGNFYASTGPQIELVHAEDDRVVVRCSPAVRIVFAGPGNLGRAVSGTEEQPLTEAEFTMTGSELYRRIHVVDAKGRVAWTNPLVYNQNGE